MTPAAAVADANGPAALPWTPDWIVSVSVYASIIALLVGLVTLWRVRSIDKARLDERTLLSRALRLKELSHSLAISTQLLASDHSEASITSIHADLQGLSSELQAALRILIPRTDTATELVECSVVREGYFSDAFVSEQIANARSSLTFVVWRNSRALSVENLQAILRKLQDCPLLSIRIFSMSRTAHEYAYENMERLLVIGTADAMRSEQVHHYDMAASAIQTQLAQGLITPQVVERLQYFEYDIAPFMVCTICDFDVMWGLNFFMDQGLGASDSLARTYLSAPIGSELGRKVLEQSGILEAQSTRVQWVAGSAQPASVAEPPVDTPAPAAPSPRGDSK